MCVNLSISQCQEMNLNKIEVGMVLLAKAKHLNYASPQNKWDESIEIYTIFAKDHLEILKNDPDLLFASMLDEKSKVILNQSVRDSIDFLGFCENAVQASPQCRYIFSVILKSELHQITLLTASSMFISSTIISEGLSEKEAVKFLIKNHCSLNGQTTTADSIGQVGCIAAGIVLDGSMEIIDELLNLWHSLDEESQRYFIKFLSYANNELSLEILLRLLESETGINQHFGPLVTALTDMPGDVKRSQQDSRPCILSKSYEYNSSIGGVVLKTSNLGTFSDYLPKIKGRLENVEKSIENKEPVRQIIKAWKQNGLEGFAIEQEKSKKLGCIPLLLFFAIIISGVLTLGV